MYFFHCEKCHCGPSDACIASVGLIGIALLLKEPIVVTLSQEERQCLSNWPSDGVCIARATTQIHDSVQNTALSFVIKGHNIELQHCENVVRILLDIYQYFSWLEQHR